MQRWLMHLQRAIRRGLRNDVLMLARAGAYSAIICIFPIVLVTTAVLATSSTALVLRSELHAMLYQMFPPDVPPLVLSYFHAHHRSLQLILSSAIVFVLGANSVMTTLMESLRRAYRLPEGGWSITRQIWIAFVLTFLSFVPLVLASMFVVFGHQIEMWMDYQRLYDVRLYVVILARVARWMLTLATSVTMLAIIYHLGAPRTQSWRRVLPGSILATALWFPSTLVFGWYVTRHANYWQVYGSLGAGIALLIWLYIILVIVMFGAEFNAEIFPKR